MAKPLTIQDIDEIAEAVARALKRTARPTPWLTTGEAAARIKATPETMKTWRAKGGGPRYHGGHRFVRYHVDDLDAFVRGERA
jgi:hypothetical protein